MLRSCYIAADGELPQQAGLCGTLTFQRYKQEAPLAGSASLAAAGDRLQSFKCCRRRRVGELRAPSQCRGWRLCRRMLVRVVSLRPRNLLVNIGQPKEGLCSAAAYAAAPDELKQQAGLATH